MQQRVWIFLIVLILFPSTSALSAPAAVDGVFDLRSTSLETDGPVRLRGQWHFYWQAFHDPELLPLSNPKRIQTPGTWGSQPLEIDDHGYGTYHLKILLSDEDVGRALGLGLPSIASAYELYIEGERITSTGRIGTSQVGMAPAAMPKSIYYTARDPEIDLVLHISNFNQRKGGIWSDIRLGTAEQITSERERRFLFQAMIATGLLLIGFYHLVLYLLRRERSTLDLGLASLLLFLRNLYVGELLGVWLFPAVPWEIWVKIEYLSVFWGIGFLVLFVAHLYENSLPSWITQGLMILLFTSTLPILFLPASIYTEWFLPYSLQALCHVVYMVLYLFRASLQRRKGAAFNLAAALIFLAAVLNDILYYNFILNTIDLVALGLFLLILTQMFILASKFASAFHEAESMKDRLESINEQLEVMVEQRTEALRQSHKELLKAEKARRDLLSNITHEIGNPLASIIGYLRRLKEGASGDSFERHIEIAYQKALSLERLTDDLRQLAILESNQLTYQLRSVTVEELYRELESIYDWSLVGRRVDLNFDLLEKGSYEVLVDLSRIAQVFTNIVNNAFAHTKESDRIAIHGRVLVPFGACAIIIRDGGTGIRPADQKLIFERFYRVRGNSEEHHAGSGLGLSISKAIIEAHQGRIGVRSKYGRGSTFYFILPLLEPQEKWMGTRATG